MKHEVRAMQARRSGSIINISSTYGQEGAAVASINVGAKYAGEGITNSMAREVANSGIRVNAVVPGSTDTGMLTRFRAALAQPPQVLVAQVPLGVATVAPKGPMPECSCLHLWCRRNTK